MEHVIPLDELPKGFKIPRDLSDRLRFDQESHRLVHLGFMSKADFDRLAAQTNDWAFRRKLDELFRLCSEEDEAKKTGLRKLFGSLTHFWA